MSLYKKTGIYKITNTFNNKIYIGFASTSFGDRRDSHFACLRNGYHFNKRLQEDFDKYGEDCFIFEVLEYIESDNIDVYKDREKFYISAYNSIENGYNLNHGGDCRTRPSNDRIREMAIKNREINKGKVLNGDTIDNMKMAKLNNSYRCHGKNKSTILTKEQVESIKRRLMAGESVNEIAREFNVSFSCISCINVGKTWKSVDVDGWEEYVKNKKY